MLIRSIHKFGTMPMLFADDGNDTGGGGGAAPAGGGETEPTDQEREAAALTEILKFGEVEPPATGAEPPPAGEDGKPPEGEGKPDEGGDQDENSVQKRIDELTAGKREAERAAAESARRADAVEKRLQELEAKGKPEGDKEIDPDAEPDPKNYDFGEADAKFIADTARFQARIAFREEAENARVQSELTKLEERWQAEVAKVGEDKPDFKEKVIDGAERNEWACTPLMRMAIQNSDVSTDIAYHLATNVDESKRIATLHPMLQAREMGKLEGRFEAERAAKATQNANPAPKTTSAAPKPPAHQTRGDSGRFQVADDTDDFASFDAKYADVTRT